MFVNNEKHIDKNSDNLTRSWKNMLLQVADSNTADMKPKTDLHQGCGFSFIFCGNQAALLPVESINTL